jgi:hypothetical protein
MRFQQRPRSNAESREGDLIMRNRWLCASFMAASITIATAELWGQELSAEVPFPFQANGADMAPGRYAINRVSRDGVPVVRLMNLDTRKSVVATGLTNYAQAGKPSPRLIFHCAERECALAEIWGWSQGIDFPRSRPKNKETQVAIIPIKAKTKGE